MTTPPTETSHDTPARSLLNSSSRAICCPGYICFSPKARPSSLSRVTMRWFFESTKVCLTRYASNVVLSELVGLREDLLSSVVFHFQTHSTPAASQNETATALGLHNSSIVNSFALPFPCAAPSMAAASLAARFAAFRSSCAIVKNGACACKLGCFASKLSSAQKWRQLTSAPSPLPCSLSSSTAHPCLPLSSTWLAFSIPTWR